MSPSPLSWGVFGFTIESPPAKVFIFSSWIIFWCVHIRGNRNASCSAGVARSGSVAWVRKVAAREEAGLLSAAKLICAGESQVPEVSSRSEEHTSELQSH